MFIGAVLLDGAEDQSFDSLGLNIMVKYSADGAMQKLSRSAQSGGEKSVATALYMLALQEMTLVPFR